VWAVVQIGAWWKFAAGSRGVKRPQGLIAAPASLTAFPSHLKTAGPASVLKVPAALGPVDLQRPAAKAGTT